MYGHIRQEIEKVSNINETSNMNNKSEKPVISITRDTDKRKKERNKVEEERGIERHACI